MDDLASLLAALIGFDHPFGNHRNRIRPLALRALTVAAGNLDRSEVADAFLVLTRARLNQQWLPFRAEDSEWAELDNANPVMRHRLASLLVQCPEITLDEISRMRSHGILPVRQETNPDTAPTRYRAFHTAPRVWDRFDSPTDWREVSCVNGFPRYQ